MYLLKIIILSSVVYLIGLIIFISVVAMALWFLRKEISWDIKTLVLAPLPCILNLIISAASPSLNTNNKTLANLYGEPFLISIASAILYLISIYLIPQRARLFFWLGTSVIFAILITYMTPSLPE